MRILIVLQALSAAVYYATAPFALTWQIGAMLILNLGALAFLWRTPPDPTHAAFRQARWVFTITLFLLELVIQMTDSPISTTEIQGLANDAEVLLTGMLLGVLWQDRFRAGAPRQ